MSKQKTVNIKQKITSQGFTLIEMLISIAGFTILMLGVVALISNIFTVNRQQGVLLTNQDQVRRVSFQIMAEPRNGVTSNTGSFPLETVAAQQLTFYADIDGGLDIERVRYFVQNGELKKGIVKPTGSPLSYNFGSESITTVLQNIGNGVNPIFYYYDGTYNGVTENFLTQPVNATQVTLVKSSLEVYLRGGIQNTNKYTVTAIGAIRNLKTNLGD